MAQEQDAQYERLGGRGRKLTIIDAIAQSVGFMGPVFSIAFLVPLLVGIISATGKGGGNAAPLSVLLAALGVLALGWIVAQYTPQDPGRRLALRLRHGRPRSAPRRGRPDSSTTSASSRWRPACWS